MGAFSKLMRKVTSKATRSTMEAMAKRGGIALAESALGAGGAYAMSELIGEGKHKRGGKKRYLSKKKKKKKKKANKGKKLMKSMIGKGIGGYLQGGQAAFDLLAPETKWSRPTPSWAHEITHLRRYSKQLDQ